MSERGEFDPIFDRYLDGRKAAHQIRRRRPLVQIGSTYVQVDGRRLINFASNDYLGLAHHPALADAVAKAAREHGTGSGAAALITGHTGLHAAAERALAAWKGTGDALLFSSGYQANHGVIQALAAAGDGQVRFLLDKLVHASLLDAVRGSGAGYRIFPHNGLRKLARLLADAPADQMQVVVTESIFSMDGDAADLAGLAELKRRHRFLLVLDEAHASGVYGKHGAGYAEECGLARIVDATIVTLSKAIGLQGGAVCGSSALIETIVNAGRAYIYSTSVAPSVAAGTIAALEVLRAEPQRQQRVRASARRLRGAVVALGYTLPAGDSPIIPIVVGEESEAMRLAGALLIAGYLVPAVRPPTVPRGASRLRVTLSSAHSDAEIDGLIGALAELRKVQR